MVRQSVAVAEIGSDGASDGDSDGVYSEDESEYTDSDDREGLDEMLKEFDAEYGDKAYYLTDLERLTYTGKVTQEAGITAISVSLITVRTCRHMEAGLAK